VLRVPVCARLHIVCIYRWIVGHVCACKLIRLKPVRCFPIGSSQTAHGCDCVRPETEHTVISQFLYTYEHTCAPFPANRSRSRSLSVAHVERCEERWAVQVPRVPRHPTYLGVRTIYISGAQPSVHRTPCITDCTMTLGTYEAGCGGPIRAACAWVSFAASCVAALVYMGAYVLRVYTLKPEQGAPMPKLLWGFIEGTVSERTKAARVHNTYTCDAT
jgi:hypothetical protein